jgi:hypothetical protein
MGGVAGGNAVNGKTMPRLLCAALAAGLMAGVACGGGNKTAGPGPSKVVAGVPVGYARSKSGAITAAGTYFRVIAETIGQGEQARSRVLGAITVPERRDEILGAAGAETLKAIESTLAGRQAISRAGVLGQRLLSYTNDRAEVKLWGVSVLAAEKAQAQAGWGSGTVELRWRNGDWKLWSAPPGTDGPTPALSGNPTPNDEFLTGVKDLEPIQ